MKYEFDRNDALRFAQSHSVGRTRESGNELTFEYCPYCKGGQNGKDKFKFSINLTTGMFQCLRASCNAHGNMITLARDFDFHLNREIDEYYIPRKKYKKPKNPKKPIEPKDKAIKYMASRGISESIVKRYEITTDKRNENILVFPFYDDKGQLTFIKYRNMEFKKGDPGSKEWCEAGCKPILFGMKQCAENHDRIVITEGQMDSLSVAEAGIDNAVSVPSGANGFTWVPYCWDWMCSFSEIIIFGDYERGHMTLLDDIKRRFDGKVKYVRPEDYMGCKDANEVLHKYGKEAVRKAVENAVAVPIKRVVAIQDIGVADFSKIPKLQTGIQRLDGLLGGGLPFGTLAVITGKRGDGKSTFSNGLMVQAVEQGNTAFIYSGEMRKEYVKRSICFQAAGRSHIVDGFPNYTGQTYISNHNTELINHWLSDRIYIYDSDLIEEDEKEDLLKTLELSIKQNGVNVILIDNLMTAMYLNETRTTDKYDRQGRFVRRLARMASKYNILILLVAHKRKNSFTTDANDEVSGSADITNLASVVISYDRGANDEINKGIMEESQRKLILSKNRLFGDLDYKGIILSYDRRSTRVYDDSEGRDSGLYREYSWKEHDEWKLAVEDQDLPFVID